MATLGVAIVFSVVNFEPAGFHYLFGQTSLPLSILLFGAFALGFVLGLILDAWVLYKQRTRIRRLEKRVAGYQSEVSNLRKLPLEDFRG